MSAEKISKEIRRFTRQVIEEDIIANHMETGQKETAKGQSGASHTTDILMVPERTGLDQMEKLKNAVSAILYGISTKSALISRQPKKPMKIKRKKILLMKVMLIYQCKNIVSAMN